MLLKGWSKKRSGGYVVALLSLLVALLWSAVSAADELRVVDLHGLTRALAQVASGQSATVEVHVGAPFEPGSAVVLTNIDGLGGERRAPVTAQGAARFHAIPAGTWRISLDGSASSLRRVVVTSE